MISNTHYHIIIFTGILTKKNRPFFLIGLIGNNHYQIIDYVNDIQILKNVIKSNNYQLNKGKGILKNKDEFPFYPKALNGLHFIVI
jgi:hypothetical protein